MIFIFKKYKFDLIGLVFLVIILIFLLYNLFSNALIGGTNDMEVQAYKLWYLKNSLIDYHQIPSWTSDNFGGRPFLMIYQPLTFYLSLPISLIFGGILATKIVFLVFSIISLIGFYFLAKYLFKKIWLAFLSSLIFIAFPANIMAIGGGTMTQVVAVTFVPFIFLVYEKLVESPKLRYFALLGLLQGLILLTHHAVGGTVFLALLVLIAYDGIIKRKIFIYKTIPFLILGAIISLVFLIPSYQISNTLNFSVVQQSASEGFRPLSILRFFDKEGSRAEYIGAIAFISLFGYLLGIKKKKDDKILRYWLICIVLLLVGLILYHLIPSFIKSTLEKAARFFAVLSVTLSIVAIAGIKDIAKYLVVACKKYNLLNMPEEGKLSSRLKSAFILILVVLIFLSYTHFTPTKGNELKIPDGVMNFYKNISEDKEYYRIEDQAFAPFGFSPIIHKHGVLNGGNYLAAPKYHFWFWSNSWSLLQNKQGAYNFASLYGALSIKYILFKNEVKIPYLKEIDKGKDYYIYRNEKFLKYARLVPNVAVIDAKEPDYISLFFNELNNMVVPFDKIGVVHSSELKNDITPNKSLSGNITLLEKKPGFLKLKADNLKGRTYLAIAESYHPYWKAYEDEKKLSVYEGIPSTLIIPLESNGIITIKFTPPKIRFILFLVSLVVLIGLIGLIIYDLRKH